MLTIVIPTLQKSVSTLELLLKTLDSDPAVGEIIVIDNSLKGLDFNSSKIRVIIPEENLYVNPSWNLGVKEAKFDKIGLLNDDIAIPENLCTEVSQYIKEEVGIIGIKRDSVFTQDHIDSLPDSMALLIESTRFRNFNFGIVMFFHKNSYVKIPQDIKIFYGDDWLFMQNKKNKKENFVVNSRIYHLGSLTSSNASFNLLAISDKKLYSKKMYTWYKHILYFEESETHYKLKILGLAINIKK